MKRRFSLLFILFFGACNNVFSLNDTNCTPQKPLEQTRQIFNNSPTVSDCISSLTISVETINNLIETENNRLTFFTILISIIALLFTAAGVFGFWKINKKLESKNNVISKKISIIETTKTSIKELLDSQKYQNAYMQKINEYLFKITNTINDNVLSNPNSYMGAVENSEDRDSSTPTSSTQKTNNDTIREELWHDYYIITLLLPKSEKTSGAFDYLKVQGTKNDIDVLKFIAKNDPNKEKREEAKTTIGFILGRLHVNEQFT